MKRYIVLSLVAFTVVFGTAFGLLTDADRRAANEELAGGEEARLLQREAELISYFCLSRIPPVYSKTTIPAEWEKALGTRIRLREGVGEITSEAGELAARAADIQNLGVGESVSVTSGSGNQKQFWLVYRPAEASNQLLVLSKSGATAAQQLHKGNRASELLLSLLAGLIAAIATGIAARLLFPPGSKSTES